MSKRNSLFKCFALSLLLAVAVPAQRATQAEKPAVIFEEVTAKANRINWVHDNAHSPDRYLPETVGGGGAFFDYDGDGWQDLFVANIDQEFFSLYRNEGDLTFVDLPGEIAASTQLLSGWGLKFFDYDNDGDPDLLLANGHPDDFIEMRVSRVKYREPLVLFENTGKSYVNVSARSGAVFSKDFPARGMTVGDYDNDGDLDALVINNGDAPVLLRNEGGNRGNWLGLQLVARKSNPGAVGAVITWQAASVKRSRLKTSGGSYLASHDPREILGIGTAQKFDAVEVRWPSGVVDKLSNPPVNSYVKVVEGQGIAAALKPAPK